MKYFQEVGFWCMTKYLVLKALLFGVRDYIEVL